MDNNYNTNNYSGQNTYGQSGQSAYGQNHQGVSGQTGYSQNTYGQTSQTGYSYGQNAQAGQSQNPYGQDSQAGYRGAYGQTTQSSYGQSNQSAYGQTAQGSYGQTAYAGSNPYQQSGSKPKKKSGFGIKLVKCAAIALVFGLVAGTAFTGVNYMGNRVLGINGSETTGESGNNDSFTISGGSSVQQTGVGMATDLADVSAIFDEAIPSIVAITNTGTVTYHTFWGPQKYQSESRGSGIIIGQSDEFLYIVTNNHVVQNAETLTVQFFDDTTVSCEIQGTDPSDDLAVVKVQLSSIEKDTRKNIKVATVGDSKLLKVGNPAIAIGNALGYGQSLSCGHISALGRTVTVQDEGTGKAIVNNNMIQTTAAINPGNSGGALLNAMGEVIGINSAKYSDTDVEGVGYAIPIADALPIVEQLIETGKIVEPDSAYLGIQGQDISADVAQAYDMPEGVYVYQVLPGSAAEAAGINYRDIITALDGHEVKTMSDLKSLLAGYEPGQQVTVTLQRLGGDRRGYEEIKIPVTLGSSKGAQK